MVSLFSSEDVTLTLLRRSIAPSTKPIVTQSAQLAIYAKSFSYVAALLFVISTNQKASGNITQHHVRSNIDQDIRHSSPS